MKPTGKSGTTRERLGFRDGDRSTHSSRTLMLPELQSLFEATEADASLSDYRQAVVQDNVLGKRTQMTREHTVRKLKALYGLDMAIPVFRLLRTLWSQDVDGQPVMALLCGMARDPLLRMTAAPILEPPIGAVVAPEAIEELVRQGSPQRFAESSVRSIARNVLSSWTQSGHLRGKVGKQRQRAKSTAGAAAYAVALGFMEDHRGELLLSTFWTSLLDCAPDELRSLLVQASRRGWLDFRTAGDVVDVRPEKMFTEDELELLNG